MLNLRGAVAIVTGGSRGIGAAICEELGREGAKVVVNYSGSQEPAEEIAEKIRQTGGGGEAVAIQADVSDPNDAQRLIDQAVEHFGRVDILVNNAGTNVDATLDKLDVESWDSVVQLDLNGCFYTLHAALPHMMEQENGAIVNMSSFVGEAGNMGQANYAAAKSGLLGYTKTAALELAQSGITVNAVCPGFIETDMTAAIPEEMQEKIVKTIPMGRFGQPEDIAQAVRFCIENEYMTGATLDINGGVYMRT
ncbi:MAG: 3-oxoacyl-ACP reductase FabG [Actinobacteria bacterium]|nr:3-oxoacyl-ACP reductase FabG [Actinomycetota bacterium]MCA1739382.1 3-oxoacyl-ACP reductase FabG [Actinomycetota bacterium]